jgi:hypothetical protein
MDPMGVVDRMWPLLRRLMGGHTVVYRATGGRIGHLPSLCSGRVGPDRPVAASVDSVATEGLP